MRLRLAVLAAAVTALPAIVGPGIANAAPRHNHGLTINAAPNPIISGDGVLIYGQLGGANPSGQTIVLYHRVNPTPFFTRIGMTKTDAHGFYEFTRAEGIVLTNRNWFARAPSLPGNIHSLTVHERVAAALSIAASATSGDTGHPITFTGHVDPARFHVGERVYLQQQQHPGEDWHTIKSGVIGADSSYSIQHRFRTPGARDVRVLFAGDVRNIGAASDSVTTTIQQNQNPSFTINASAPIIDYGSPATITGVLYLTATSSPVPDPGVPVTLWARQIGDGRARPVANTTTGTDGGYTFTVSPQHNTEHFVQTTFKPPRYRRTAGLFEGVRDVVGLQPSATSTPVGQRITLTGSVLPDKAHLIELQRLGKDGDYHTVAFGLINHSSTYRFRWRFGNTGTFRFRTRIPGDRQNVSGTSSPAQITVTPAPVSTLPTA
jgi:hypothetical protein